MVPGPNAKNKKGGSVQVDYLIHIQEVKPWPPSQSLRSLRSVLIQWENGGRSSGSTEMVVPSFGSVIGEGKIEFNESFRLRTTLLRVGKGKDADAFQKNCLEFNLCESRRDNKTQVLATAIVDLADYGVVSEPISITAPMNSKRSFRNSSEPVLYISIQPVDKRNRSSLRDTMSKEELVEKNHGESLSALMNVDYAEEAEVASFTDDDVSSHSSLTNGGLAPQNEEIGPDRPADSKRRLNGDHNVNSKFKNDNHTQRQDLKGSSPCSSSVDLSSELESPVNGHASPLNPIGSSSMSTVNNYENKDEEANMAIGRNGLQDLSREIDAKVGAHTNGKTNTSHLIPAKVASSSNDDIDDASAEDMDGKEHQVQDDDILHMKDKNHSLEGQTLDNSPQITTRNGGLLGSYTTSSGDFYKNDRLRHVKSVRSPSDPVRSNGLVGRNNDNEMKEISASGDTENSSVNLKFNQTKSAKIFPKDIRTTISDSKIQQLEHKIKMLEGELREAAAIEASLYSVVAEHGSSVSKVHSPARRLSRLYLHVCKENLQSRRASAAKTAVSGLILVAKACGNDVPRLTFWLSNCVVLRAIISHTTKELGIQHSGRSHSERNGFVMDYTTTSSSLKWKESSASRKDIKNLMSKDFGNWESVRAFISALERVESWIFSRIVESIWWQTLTPHMQSAATKELDKFVSSTSQRSPGRTSSSSDQGQGNFSIDLWKEAFKDASERLCPVRAGGHECGCLPVIARLVMEQCVARLDVAMFNAILRESADEMPTDPVSDPISDLRVLPVPAGKSSFSAGAQLKNAIGNWSRWLTDLFDMDDDALEDEDDERQDASFKSFYLLLALSDLMMLPKDMLLSKSIRKEVCPIFGAPLIKKVLDCFAPDEFCPDPIPVVVFEALESEDAFEAGEDSVTSVPCIAAPPIYLPPSADAIASTIGELAGQPELRRSGSSVLRKSYTSDDELDELTSPLASIVLKSSLSSSGQTKPNWKRRDQSNQNAIRYELLRDVWLNSE